MLATSPENRVAPGVRPDRALLHDIIEWDVVNWSAALDYWCEHSTLRPSHCHALEIGSRHGGLSLWLALQGARVICSDLEGPSSFAVEKHARYGVADRVTYEDIDAVRIPYEEAFDIVVVKSVLGGVGRDGQIERQRAAVWQMYRALKPGGELWFAENLVGSPVHRKLRGRFVEWGGSWRYLSLPELTSFLAPFDGVSCSTHGVLGTLGRTERQRAILGRLDVLCMNAAVPRTWRYIAFGVARKATRDTTNADIARST